MTTEEKITYAARLSRVGLLQMGAIKQSCLASAKITTEVLRSLGIRARPMTASVMALTEGWLRRCEQEGRFPRKRSEAETWWEEDRAYSLGIAYDPSPQEGAWNAHMIVIADGRFLVDPSLDQLSRPQRDLPLEPVVVDMAGEDIAIERFTSGEDQAVTHWRGDGDERFVVVWSCFPDDRSYRRANDWLYFEGRYGPMARSIVKAITDMDAYGLTGDSLPAPPDLPDAPTDPRFVAREQSAETLSRIRMTAKPSRNP